MNERPAAQFDPPRRLRACWRAGMWFAVSYLCVVVMLMLLENSLVYFPTRYPRGEWSPPDLEFEDVFFEAADGTQLHGWYVAADEPTNYVLLSHGNAGNLSHRAHLLRILHDRLGVSVFIYDYRGYGRSQGQPGEQGVLQDADAAQRWLAQRAGTSPQELVLLGESLGAAVSVHLAAENGARALILNSGFTSLPDVAAYHYPWVPVRWLMRNRLDALPKIKQYHGPLLHSHSRDDEVVPFALGLRLYEAAPGPKEFFVMEGDGHNDPLPADFWKTLERFLRELE